MRNHHLTSMACLRLTGFLLVGVAGLIGAPARAEDAPARPVLHQTNGGFVTGELEDSAQPETLRWQSPFFVAPLVFDRNGVNAIHWPPPTQWPKPSGEYCFELAGNDVVFGTLVDLNEKVAVLDAPRFGRLHVQRPNIHRIYRWRDGADLIYAGPNGLTGWHELSTKKGWREESGQLESETEGTAIRGDLGLPARAAVEFEVSWKTKPNFIFALGVDEDPNSVQRAFRFEVWEGDLVVHRETEQEADVASVQEVAPGAGRAHLLAYLDQERGRIQVVSPSGKQLADLKVAGGKGNVLKGVQLINVRGDVRLERLRIGRWDGEAPREAQADKSRIHRADGSIIYGQVTKYDAASKEFVIREASGESRVAADRIASVFLSLPGDERPRAIRVVHQDGARLSGDPIKVEKGELWLSVPGIEETPRVPLAGLRSLLVLRHDAMPASDGEPTGFLELEGVRLRGHLVNGREQPGSSCLAWQPDGCTTASPLRPGVSGRIVYREPPPPPPTPRPGGATVRVQRVQPRVGVVQGFINGLSGNPPAQTTSARRSLHLRTGDTIPAEISKIDEDGITFRTQLSDSTFVSHDKVKAVELAPEPTASIRLNKSKRERLLTLPRMQKESPPTHLIRSKNGDYLRGRVTKMDDKTLQVEVRLETKDVPRDRVSRIIWLHADELDSSKKDSGKAPEGGATTRVQALRSDGIRLTFSPHQLEGAELSGKSDVLGSCRVVLSDVDQLLIGGAIERAAALLAYQQWKLQNAVEPKVSQSDGTDSAGGTLPGIESALVGKPAPDFELDLLGGKTFRLTESKGKVVVLDFWATWCGPCLQAMPQVERVTDEFKDQGVRLVAVNLQEAPKQISAMLERHKLHMTVALDRDGTVAEKYGAHAIPQTVIIDRDGKVARLYVGGGPHLEDQLRDALRAVLSGNNPKEPIKQ